MFDKEFARKAALGFWRNTQGNVEDYAPFDGVAFVGYHDDTDTLAFIKVTFSQRNEPMNEMEDDSLVKELAPAAHGWLERHEYEASRVTFSEIEVHHILDDAVFVRHHRITCEKGDW